MCAQVPVTTGGIDSDGLWELVASKSFYDYFTYHTSAVSADTGTHLRIIHLNSLEPLNI